MRNGKIARLPSPIRNELNFRMDSGKDGAEILKWLNALPEVKAGIKSGFDGVPISKQNLSEWRKGGFLEWQRHLEWIHQACELHNCTKDMENVLTPPRWPAIGRPLAVRYAALLQSWDGKPDPKFERDLRLLRGLGQDIALLQRTLQRADRQSVEYEQRAEDDMEKHSAKMKQLALSPIKAELERGSLRRMFGLFYEDDAAKRLADLVIAVKFDLPRSKKFTGKGRTGDSPVPAGDLPSGNRRRYWRRSAERRYRHPARRLPARSKPVKVGQTGKSGLTGVSPTSQFAHHNLNHNPNLNLVHSTNAPEKCLVERRFVFIMRLMVHVGIGYDVHPLVEGRPLILGGVAIPHPKGLDGHSDADVLMHAICDAILGAIGEGDIGTFFPNTDPRWKDAPSKVFLHEAARQVRLPQRQDHQRGRHHHRPATQSHAPCRRDEIQRGRRPGHLTAKTSASRPPPTNASASSAARKALPPWRWPVWIYPSDLMPKAEISWKRQTEDGAPLQCYAQHAGKRWIFLRRKKRFDEWQTVENPPVEDWLALLDSVRRRINRRLLRPEEEDRLVKIIAEQYPGTDTRANRDRNSE